MGSDNERLENPEEMETNEELTQMRDENDPMIFLVPRLQGLMDVLQQMDIPSVLRLSSGDFPYLEADYKDGTQIFFSYIPVDIGGQFILQMTKEVYVEDCDPDTLLFDITSFNMGSEFGFAAYDLVNGDVVLRAQVPEIGGVSLKTYTYYLELFDAAFEELNEALLKEDEEE